MLSVDLGDICGDASGIDVGFGLWLWLVFVDTLLTFLLKLFSVEVVVTKCCCCMLWLFMSNGVEVVVGFVSSFVSPDCFIFLFRSTNSLIS